MDSKAQRSVDEHCTINGVFTRGDRRGDRRRDDRLLVNTRGDGRHYDRQYDRHYDRRDDRLVYSLCNSVIYECDMPIQFQQRNGMH